MNLDTARAELAAFVDRHELVALQLSAGKDSAACLKLLRQHIARVVVVWANPGAPYPETVEYMAQVRRSVPRFVVGHGHQPEFIEQHGWPADSVPFEATHIGRLCSHVDAPPLVSVADCCGANLWGPMYGTTVATGATGIVRGDKHADALRPPMNHGEVIDGREYHFPLRHWLDAEVLEFLGDDAPASYRRGLTSSLDCITCTAYLSHNPGRVRELRTLDPAAYVQVQPVLMWMHGRALKHLQELNECL